MVKKYIPAKEGQLIKNGPNIKVGEVKNINIFKTELIGEFVKGSGQILILPTGVKILKIIQTLLANYLKEEIGFEEVVLPKIAPVETFRKADVLSKWDDYLIVVKPFSQTSGIKEDYIMDPLQCTCFYQFFENKIVDVVKGPVKWYDMSGPSYRNEDIDKIEVGIKQREFHRAEFIYMGTKKQVIKIRERCLLQLEKLCVSLGLKYRIVVGADCYQLKQEEFPKPKVHEEIPVKDLEIFIPQKNRWLEIAGCSVLAQTMTSRFNIKEKSGKNLWSGCVGIGLERFMYTLISYYGSDMTLFPEKIRRVCNERKDCL